MGPLPITQINDNGAVRFQKGIINYAADNILISHFHFYDLPHPHHWGKLSIWCNLDITRGSSLLVNHRTVDVQITSDRPGIP